MRLLMLAFGATAVGVVALTACGGGGNTAPSYIAPPQPPVQAGQITLGNATSQQQLPTSGGYGGVITWPTGTGVVDTSLSTTAPSNVEVVTPSAVRRAKAAAEPTVIYLTISSTSGATLDGVPGIGLTTPSATSGSWQEAEYSSTTGVWNNIETGTPSGEGVSFPPDTKQKVTLAAGGSVTLALYPGLYPEPTPTPTPTPEATPTNMIGNPNFDNGTQVVYMAPSPQPTPTTGIWTQCSITAVASSAPNPINHPVSKYTPDPGATPAAVVMKGGTSLMVGSDKPVPTQTTVPTYGTATYAAVIGSVFSNYYAEDFAYNGLCQAITPMPLGAALSMEIFANGNDGPSFLSFNVDWLNSSGQFVANLYNDDATDPITGTSSGDTSYRLITIPQSTLAPYVGTNGELFIGAYVKAGSGSGATYYSTYYFVDNVNLQGIPQ